MNSKQNCWEFKKCGREPGGLNIDSLGVCPATKETRANGLNDGINGGRACWAIAGTLCNGEVKGTLASKMFDCVDCDFFSRVVNEQGSKYKNTNEILKFLKKPD